MTYPFVERDLDNSFMGTMPGGHALSHRTSINQSGGREILPFSRRDLLTVLAIGTVTSLIDHRVDLFLFRFLFTIPSVINLAGYLAAETGGPVFGDLLQSWFQYGAVLAALLVRKPGAGTIAMTINGFGQVFLNGTHTPHLLYGVTGLGADVVFASFKYRRYDIPAVSLAGVASTMFWYPIVYFTHSLNLFPSSFIVADLAIRVLGSAVGNGLLGAAIGLVILRVAGRIRNNSIGVSLDPTKQIVRTSYSDS